MLSEVHWSPDSLVATGVYIPTIGCSLKVTALFWTLGSFHPQVRFLLYSSHLWPPVWPMRAGFSVTGIAKEGSLMSKGGMQAGQAIILTKPLGTGTIMAAAMRRRAKGRWITGLQFYS